MNSKSSFPSWTPNSSPEMLVLLEPFVDRGVWTLDLEGEFFCCLKIEDSSCMFYFFSAFGIGNPDKTPGNQPHVIDIHRFWANYSDLSRGHPKMWFGRESPLKKALIQV